MFSNPYNFTSIVRRVGYSDRNRVELFDAIAKLLMGITSPLDI